jgi:pyrroline-5-carboxylate reductase
MKSTMAINSKKIAVLGGGNIGLAITQGFIKSGVFKKENITITRATSQSLTDLKEFGVNATHDNELAIKDADFILLAVQPRQAMDLLKGLKVKLNNKKQIIISVVSALSFDEVEKVIGTGFVVVRIMPNIAISICESMTCLASNKPASNEFLSVKAIFDKLGSTLVIEEKMMAAATVLGSCGTAYMMRFMRAASQGGIQVGFHADEAQLIVAQVAKGAASLLLQNGLHPEQEIDKVTTPMGLTIKGLNEMEHNGLSSAVIKGIVHSFNEIDKIK